jgi:hypothetical protein
MDLEKMKEESLNSYIKYYSISKTAESYISEFRNNKKNI